MPNHTVESSIDNKEFSIRSIIAPLMAVIVGMIMVILDSTVVNVAVPKLVDFFATDLKTVQWTITGYTLALSAVIPLAGWMTDKFGEKRIFLMTIALFTIGSVLCAVAQTPEQLIVYRIIQGLGGGMVSPIGFAMVFKLAPPEKRGAVMGALGVPMLMAPALGPVLSGWLVENVSWHWIFLINLPIGIVAFLIGLRFLPKSSRREAPQLDKLGMILAPIAFAMLTYGVSEGGTSWTSASTITGLSVGGLALLLYIIVEIRHQQPLLELRVFRSSHFTRGIILVWIAQAALFGSMILTPLYLQQVRGYNALETGIYLLPQALMSAFFMPISGRLFDRVGARPLAFIGLGIVSTALFLLSRITAETPLAMVLVPLGLLGGGMGLTMMPLNTHILNSAPRHLVARVTPLMTAAQQVIVSFAVAGLTGYLTSQISSHMKEAAQGGNPLEAAASGFGDTYFLASCIAAVGFLLTLFLSKPKKQAEAGKDSASEGTQPDPSLLTGH
ncbi:MDR family MFS transporter [Paenibacillus barengoltzii]|uniref:Drug:H+ antiporter-2 (14 Spanner) (DHA2) family drug resistance MFS transporter n=1 Tax=Paenibacillus barengoltzii G22 TaxID=1235795 RepID=R9LDX4_9BACL|nr:MDR family MFS transporter [Paenibacillus barengoltzii]EOS56915.1 drug:H+ antiporter-2 (14 Spanner) (DHA2) family drug resistance MFS transporter [Paenibacillus barengoltzii G22]